MSILGSFEGKNVVGTRIKVTRAGDGLSKALKTEPRELRMGEKVFVVLECEVGNVGFEESNEDTGECLRFHTLRAGTASFIDEGDVKELLADQVEKNLRMEEATKGIRRLEDWPADEDDLSIQHEAGDHVGVVIRGCVLCATPALTPISQRKRKANEPGE